MENITNRNITEYQDILMECHDDAKNQHKYYRFRIPLPNLSRFEVQYGRVGKTKTVREYPIGDLWDKFNEKVKKGYKVIKTHKFFEKNLSDFDEFVKKFIGDDCFLPER